MTRYFLGIDAGGTKTHALIVNENGDAVGFGRGGPGNWESIGLDGLTCVLQESVYRALQMAGIGSGQISGAGMGLAGYDWPSQREMILGAIRPVGLDCPLEIVNDSTLGIFAGTSAGWGVSVVSGTGCNCRGRGKDLKTEGRMVGGGSHWSGEYAGGGDLAASLPSALAAFASLVATAAIGRAWKGPAFGLAWGQGWRGAYLSPPCGPDPWGYAYQVNVKWLTMTFAHGRRNPKTRLHCNDVFCISPGKNGIIETRFGYGYWDPHGGIVRRGDDWVTVIAPCDP